MKLLVTGGAGFIGSHVVEHFVKKGAEVTVFDNLCRAKLLKKDEKNALYNWNFLKEHYPKVHLIKGDIADNRSLFEAGKHCDTIIHTAAQTAVTTSVVDPEPDFQTNALGTFNVMELARKNNAAVVYCSTNKVYGDNVNSLPLIEKEKRYSFSSSHGIAETFSIDGCEHTPYGCSKLAGDVYVQDYAHLYGLNTGVFRMSCIYGTRQFGVEDQGWVAWFTIATILGKPLTIYGDGKQVRDVLNVHDLVKLYDLFLSSPVKHGVWNTGGGMAKTMSLLELLDILGKLTGTKSAISFSDWRPSDQKVYISDISKVKKDLGWEPNITPEEGVKELVEWVNENKTMF